MGWRWGAQGEVVGGWLGVWADVFGCSATPTRCRAPLCARLALVLAVAAVADDEENARCGGVEMVGTCSRAAAAAALTLLMHAAVA